MEKNLAIIGASYLQLPLIQKAKKLGYITHVFAWKINDVGERAADYFYPISIVEKECILKKCREIGICGICSIASDLAVITVNYVAEELGLNGNSLETTDVSTNKYLMRQIFKKNGDPSPKSMKVDLNTDLDKINIIYPVIVKPTDRSGSRGIFKVEDSRDLADSVKKSVESSFEKKALIEEFAEGNEYSVEYISYHGEHHFLALTKKITTGAPNFIEKAHIEPADVDSVILNRVKQTIEHALDSLGIKNSASHSEIKIDIDGNIKIIEIGGRMGGDCIGSDLVWYSTGIDYVKAVIQVACGKKPDLEPCGEKMHVKAVYIFSHEDLVEYKRIKQTFPQKILREVFLNESLIGKATNSSDRAGCYIIREDETDYLNKQD